MNDGVGHLAILALVNQITLCFPFPQQDVATSPIRPLTHLVQWMFIIGTPLQDV